jgi:UDP-N-acetyl-D-galactosamine dehydrogenase
MIDFDKLEIAIIGLGYVGLPLAVEFSKKFPVTGYDINDKRISELRRGYDATKEITSAEISEAKNLTFSCNVEDLRDANVYIVTVPTPIDDHKQPDLSLLIKACELIGAFVNFDDVVIFESTVYPGATEEKCIPVLERCSGLVVTKGLNIGYSPERINPGDRNRKLVDIPKVTSGSDVKTADFVDNLYSEIIIAGTWKASSIKVAEAAKVIENTQRDVNIALINELSIIFNKLSIDTLEVLQAAGTKWNFLPFRPGLVGGHCIGVDPYYLTHKAQSIGHHPEIILAGRRINDGMASYISASFVKHLIKRSIKVDKARVLIMGLTFKENCPDLRNTKVVDIINELKEYGMEIDVVDPCCSKDQANEVYGIEVKDQPEHNAYDGIIFTVAHDSFRDLSLTDVQAWGKPKHLIYDIKYIFPESNAVIKL